MLIISLHDNSYVSLTKSSKSNRLKTGHIPSRGRGLHEIQERLRGACKKDLVAEGYVNNTQKSNRDCGTREKGCKDQQ